MKTGDCKVMYRFRTKSGRWVWLHGSFQVSSPVSCCLTACLTDSVIVSFCLPTWLSVRFFAFDLQTPNKWCERGITQTMDNVNTIQCTMYNVYSVLKVCYPQGFNNPFSGQLQYIICNNIAVLDNNELDDKGKFS